MILFYNILLGAAQILAALVQIFIILFIVRAIVSWFSPDPYNPLVRFLNSCTDPILDKVRAKIPSIGRFDFSILIVVLVLYFVQTALVQSMMEYTQIHKEQYKRQMLIKDASGGLFK